MTTHSSGRISEKAGFLYKRRATRLWKHLHEIFPPTLFAVCSPSPPCLEKIGSEIVPRGRVGV